MVHSPGDEERCFETAEVVCSPMDEERYFEVSVRLRSVVAAEHSS